MAGRKHDHVSTRCLKFETKSGRPDLETTTPFRKAYDPASGGGCFRPCDSNADSNALRQHQPQLDLRRQTATSCSASIVRRAWLPTSEMRKVGGSTSTALATTGAVGRFDLPSSGGQPSAPICRVSARPCRAQLGVHHSGSPQIRRVLLYECHGGSQLLVGHGPRRPGRGRHHSSRFGSSVRTGFRRRLIPLRAVADG
jgi:hypothetical protein